MSGFGFKTSNIEHPTSNPACRAARRLPPAGLNAESSSLRAEECAKLFPDGTHCSQKPLARTGKGLGDSAIPEDDTSRANSRGARIEAACIRLHAARR